MKKSESPEEFRPDAAKRFTTALASVLSVSRSEIQGKLAPAKAEKPSPHTRYSYDPAKDRS